VNGVLFYKTDINVMDWATSYSTVYQYRGVSDK